MSSITVKLAARVAQFRQTIWSADSLADHGPRGWFHASLRVLWLTITGFRENRGASRAAALSFSSLIGLGPLVALGVMIAGFMVNEEDPDLAANTLNRVLVMVAPQLTAHAEIEVQAHDSAATTTERPVTSAIKIHPRLLAIFDTFVASARNGTVGAVGAITLIIIGLQLLTTIETAFNEIWGVRRGRSWIMRIVFYWAVISLGPAALIALVTGPSANALLHTFSQVLPFGEQLAGFIRFFLPLGGFAFLVLALTIFYRTVPHTHVNWVPAGAGAALVAVLLWTNNQLAFLYISWGLRQKALYESLAIPVVLMFGLFAFWLLVLLGGQVSYAIQNVRFPNSRAAWNTLAESRREHLSLVVLLTVCRRFFACQTPPTAAEIGQKIRVPDQWLNECLHRLVHMKLLASIPAAEGQPKVDECYMPARPLGRTTLAHFKASDHALGVDPHAPMYRDREPLLKLYHDANQEFLDTGLFSQPLDQLFEQHPLPEPAQTPASTNSDAHPA